MGIALVSVIVPVYNVEQYIARCIDSLLQQRYQKYELILIDDGSTDCSGVICDQYQKKDQRIRVFHKENGGLSDARNKGLEIANGELITFVDSDDWVSPFFLEELVTAIMETGSDICECEKIRTSEDINNCTQIMGDRTSYCAEEAMRLLIQDQEFHQHVWNKIYRRHCIEGILFEYGKQHEDEYWTYQVFGKAQKITKLATPLYYYYQRDSSIIGKAFNINRLDGLEAKLQRQNYIERFFPNLKNEAKVNLFSTCIYNGQMTLKYLYGEEKEAALRKIDIIQKKSCPKKSELCNVRLKERIWFELARLSFWNLCRIRNALGKGL